MGHVVLLSDVNALLNGICKEVKMSCPKMTKVPKIKKVAGGNAVLSKDTSDHTVCELTLLCHACNPIPKYSAGH